MVGIGAWRAAYVPAMAAGWSDCARVAGAHRGDL